MYRSLLLVLLLLPVLSVAQRAQRIKGSVVDKESKTPLIGVSIAVADINPGMGAASDADGHFVIDSLMWAIKA